MGRKCCVPGCQSNYYSDSHISVFKFPSDDARKAEWVRKIHRDNFTPSKTSVVCILHFSEDFISRNIEATLQDGTVVSYPRKYPLLLPNSYPSIFPNQPKYLTEEVIPKRKSPSNRAELAATRDNESAMDQFEAGDKFSSLESIFQKYNDNYFDKIWQFKHNGKFISIFKINFDGRPKLEICINISESLTVDVWYLDTKFDNSKFSWILGKDNVCDRWSKLENLLSYLNSYNETNCCVEDKVSFALKILDECSNESIHDSKKFKFLVDQLILYKNEHPHYSPETLLWSCLFYYSSPHAYKLIRKSNVLTMPHPSYLKKLSFNSDMLNAGMQESHLNYLQKKISKMEEDEKLVNLLLDEIHVSPTLSYKSGSFYGISDNSSAPATSLQAFMITSIKSKNKDIVALYPVRNLTAKTLQDLIKTVLSQLHLLGFKVLSLISDNNRVNRKAFEEFCGGSLKEYIMNPFDNKYKLFFLFDTVHIIKCIRNNWLNVKSPIQTFVFPPFNKEHTNENVHKAPLQALKTLHDLEKNLLIKYAPDLSQKVLYPSSFERQNVQFVVKLFNEKNISALKTQNIVNSESVCILIGIIVK